MLLINTTPKCPAQTIPPSELDPRTLEAAVPADRERREVRRPPGRQQHRRQVRRL